MIINKPTFDTNAVRVGMALYMTELLPAYRGLRNALNFPVLVTSVSPLVVEVVYVDSEGDRVPKTIKIDDVVSGDIKLQNMEVVENGK